MSIMGAVAAAGVLLPFDFSSIIKATRLCRYMLGSFTLVETFMSVDNKEGEEEDGDVEEEGEHRE